MGTLERIGPSAPPAAVMRILNRFNRDELSAAIEVLVELLDIWDGDADLEVDHVEDDFFAAHVFAQIDTGPGCEISDPDCGADDVGEPDCDRERDDSECDSGLPIPGGGSGDC